MKTDTPTRFNLAARNIDVTHSKVIAGRFQTATLHDPSWHALQATAYKAAYDQLGCQDIPHLEILKKLSEISGATVKPSEHARGSYLYCSAIRASIQGRSAIQSLRIAKKLAQEFDLPFEITVAFPPGSANFGGQSVTLWWSHDAIFQALD